MDRKSLRDLAWQRDSGYIHVKNGLYSSERDQAQEKNRPSTVTRSIRCICVHMRTCVCCCVCGVCVCGGGCIPAVRMRSGSKPTTKRAPTQHPYAVGHENSCPTAAASPPDITRRSFASTWFLSSRCGLLLSALFCGGANSGGTETGRKGTDTCFFFKSSPR